MKFQFVVVSALMLAGCVNTPVRDARLEYQQSVETYKACVLARGVAACEAQRVVMETDERKYNNVDASWSGTSTTHNINVKRQ